ncbi:MAG TPA: glucosyl-3-phosphoglycerate synthase [Anaerolineales bacterium]|nr:glucosyl-3-phosphoglycerate synthase [Anaerolineales bacterium]
MENSRSISSYQKILIPITHGCDAESLLAAACLLVDQGTITLVGMVGVSFSESLSLGAITARRLRQSMHELAYDERIRVLERVHVSHDIWEDLMDVIDEESPDLLILNWPKHFDDLNFTPAEILTRPICNILLVRGPIPKQPEDLLVALRGSPYAEDTLRISLAIARKSQARIASLHMLTGDEMPAQEVSFRGLARVLDNIPEINQLVMQVEDPVQGILDASARFDLVVLGASLRSPYQAMPIGLVAEHVLRESSVGVMVLKTTRPPAHESELLGQSAISILVDKWFAENTYHADEFSDLNHLLELKNQQGLSISLALPALNEEETVGNVIQTIQDALVKQVPLLDEILLMDSNSTDRTREIAEGLGVPVYIHQNVLTEHGSRPGKGEALWKSLYVSQGDIIIWVDTDIVNIHPRFVYGLLGPLLVNPDIQFIKGFYRRPLKVGQKVQAGGGGRVTELTARPLLNLFYPELSGIIQPLSGEYGGRRSALEKLVFFSGYGVETGLLIDVFEKFGLGAIAQVDLLERIHHNQPLESLSKMSFAIIQTVMRKLEKRYGQGILEDINKTMKLIRYEPGRLFLEVEEVAERERPPMIDIPEYRQLLDQ